MNCQFKKYRNLKEYCITCAWGSRFGCILERPGRPFDSERLKQRIEKVYR